MQALVRGKLPTEIYQDKNLLADTHAQLRTALFAAAGSGKSVEIVAALLAAKSNPNLFDPTVRSGRAAQFLSLV